MERYTALIFLSCFFSCCVVGRHFDRKLGMGHHYLNEAIGFFLLASLGLFMTVLFMSLHG